MTETLKEMFIALGIFLGLLSPQTDPHLNIRLCKTVSLVSCSLEIENALNEDIQELIRASSTLRLQVDIFEGREKQPFVTVYHTITRDLVSGLYTVYYSSDDSYHSTDNQDASFRIFSGFYNLPLLTIEEFEALPLKSLRFRASVMLEEQGDFDGGVLWNYKQPEAKFSYKSIKEIPY